MVTVTVPISYKAAVVVKGGRTVRDEWFSEYVEVDIDAVATEDAPVALAWEKSYYDREAEAEGAYAHEVRLYDGHLWEKLEYGYSGRKPEPVSFERMAKTVRQGQSSANPLMIGPEWRHSEVLKSGIRPLDPAAWRSADTSDQTMALERLQEKAESVIVIDGMIWQRTTEPCYSVHHSAGRDHRSGERYSYAFVSILDSVPAQTHETIYRADRYQDLVAFTKSRWGVEPDQEKNVEIAIFIPEAIKYDDEWPPLYRGIKRAVEYDKSSISDAPVETMIEWGRLRDALNRCPEDETDAGIRAELVAAAHNFMEYGSALPDSPGSSRTLQEAFSRWDARHPELVEIDLDGPAR